MIRQDSKTFLNTGSWLLSITIAGLLFTGCKQKNTYVAPPPPQVTVSKPAQRAVTDYAEFTGTTEAFESVEIRARVDGYLQSIHFQPGRLVSKEDLLFIIDPKPFQAKLDEAEAELESRQAELKQTEATLKRKELAFKANAVSEVEVIQARADRDVAQSAIQAALAAIETAKLKLSYTEIRSPISGRIGRNLVDVGNLVGAEDRTLLTTIVRDDPIYAYFNVNERDLLNYQKRHPHRDPPTNGNGESKVFLGLPTEEDYDYEGRIDFVDNRLDPSTGTIQVRGVFRNSDHLLWPGLFVRIRVPFNTRKSALLVPDASLGTDQRGEYLLAVNNDNVVEYRSVRTGPRVGELRVIEAGISSEDRVITSGIQRARPGLKVTPEEAAQQKAATGQTPSGPSQ
jgi:RND family efflux transporter MFP subunit